MAALIDEVLPAYDVNEVHAIEIEGSPPDVLDAARAVTPREIRAMRPLMGLRALPGLLGRQPTRLGPDVPFLEQALALNFLVLGERPGEELVVGAIGRFWSPAGNRPLAIESRERFSAFAEPGFAKAAMNFAASPQGSGARLSTETRIAATDAAARRNFRLYWLLIGPWSGLIRRSMLAAVRRRVQEGR